MTDSTSLAGIAAALHLADDIIITFGLGENQGLTNDELQCGETKIFINATVIHDDITGSGNQTNPSHRTFAAAGTIIFNAILYHCRFSLSLFAADCPDFGALCFMRMFRVSIDSAFFHHLLTETRMR